MKLFEVMVGNYSFYVVAHSESHAKHQLMAMRKDCFTRQAYPLVTGSVLCDAGFIDMKPLYH